MHTSYTLTKRGQLAMNHAMINYSQKTIAELLYIQQDAYEAAQCAKSLCNSVAEAKYLDQVNDASTELFKRRKGA